MFHLLWRFSGVVQRERNFNFLTIEVQQLKTNPAQMITGISVKLCNVMSCLSCQEVEVMVALQLRPLQSQRPPSDH